MKKHALFILFAVAYCQYGTSQSIEQPYPQMLTLPADSFHVRFSNSPRLIPMRITADTIDMGTDGTPGMSLTIYTGTDSVIIPYTNFPYWLVYYVPLQSPRGKSVYRLHFNGVAAWFPPDYIRRHKGNVQVEIPAVYELANILWTLSPSGQRASDLVRQGAYYKQVSDYFKPWMDHPVFKKMDFPDSLYPKYYYDFRENSFAFSFKGDELVWEGPYYYVMGDDWDNYSSLFRRLLPLIADFAKQSKFREFYKNNQAFYARQVQRQTALMPVRNMWTWLEQQFPTRKYQSYKVVFSPLIGGSHSTQQFATYIHPEIFREVVMFVCGPDRFDQDSLTEKQKEGLLSGIVFTEIDHNYVNPVTNKYAAAVDSIFSNRALWAGSNTGWYDNPVAVFNEYMTHAVFCLWVLDQYDKSTADFVIGKRESLMTDRRQFIRFREFNRALIALRQANPGRPVADLYPAIVDWCRTVQ